MTFSAVVPFTGVAGWRFLQETYTKQSTLLSQAPQNQRDTDYFREKIGSVQNAETLVADRRLLQVALGAFGLADDLDSRAFVQKILDDGTDSSDALSNRLADDRYRRFSNAFGFGPGAITQTTAAGFADTIVAQFDRQQFELSVGEQDEPLRIALYAQRELQTLTTETTNQTAMWFSILAQPPLRSFFESALGVPSELAKIDIDKQHDVFRAAARETFGTDDLVRLQEPDHAITITNRFLARRQIADFSASQSSAAIALSLLGG